MAKVRVLRIFYKTVTKKSNRKSDDNVPRFYLLHLIVTINLVLVTRYKDTEVVPQVTETATFITTPTRKHI